MNIDQPPVHALDRPLVHADQAFEILDAPTPNMAPPESTIQPSAVAHAWDALIDHLSSGQSIDQHHPLLVALLQALMETGVLPTNAPLTESGIAQFHDWMMGMMPNRPQDMMLIEGWLLAQLSDANPQSGVQQISVCHGINEFQQFSVTTHVKRGDAWLTLGPFSATPSVYDHALHASSTTIFTHVVEHQGPTLDYSQAHTALALSDADTVALNNWFEARFPQGIESDSAVGMADAIYTALLDDGFEYLPDNGDSWASVADTLGSGSGDCEDFSHLLHAAFSYGFAAWPPSDAPQLSVVAGLVGQGAYVLGHSVLHLQVNGDTHVYDMARTVVADSTSRGTLLANYRQQVAFNEVLHYNDQATTITASQVDLASFSTASSQTSSPSRPFITYVDSMLQSSGITDSSLSYSDLIRSVIEAETGAFEENKGLLARPEDELVFDTDLVDFQVVNFFGPEEIDNLIGNYELSMDEVVQLNEIVHEAMATNQPITLDSLDYLLETSPYTNIREVIYMYLEFEKVIGYDWFPNTKSFSKSYTDIHQKLMELGIISAHGEIDPEKLEDSATLTAFKAFMTIDFGGEQMVSSQADRVLAMIRNKHYVFSSGGGVPQGDNGLARALGEFEALSETLFKGFLGSPVGTKLDGGHTLGQSRFAKGDSDSLFIRTDHNAIQEFMSRFLTVQNIISAHLTAIFSFCDMVESLSAKLGNEHSMASESANHRQKIMQAFNSYSGAMNESLHNVMDMFEKSVQKVNEARYQTAVAKIEDEYKGVLNQLKDQMLADQSSIHKNQIMMALSQDYYRMLSDNRKSMQSAMVDVPNFGPNLLPSTFSGFLIEHSDEMGELTSIQIWSYLVASGVINEQGMLTDGHKTKSDIEAKVVINRDDSISVADSDNEGMKQFKALLQQELVKFKGWMRSATSDQKTQLRATIHARLGSHASTQQDMANGKVLQIVHPSISSFDTSSFIPSIMDMMARDSDELYYDPKTTGVIPFHGIDDDIDIDIAAQHNRFNEMLLSEDSWIDYLKKFEKEPVDLLFPIDFKTFGDEGEYNLTPVQKEQLSQILETHYHDRLLGFDYFSLGPLGLSPKANYELMRKLYFERYINGMNQVIYRPEIIQPSHQPFTSEDLFNSLKDSGMLVEDDAGKFNVDLTNINNFSNKYSDEYSSAIVDAIIQELRATKNPNALHLSRNAAAVTEPGSGFQMVNVEMMAMAKKNLAMMNMVRRIFMTLVSAQAQFIDRLAARMSEHATQSSHYLDTPMQLMESHMRLADRQLSTIQTQTRQMVDRINDLHKLRLNLVKQTDPTKRRLSLASEYLQMVGAILMVVPNAYFQGIGVLITMASLALGTVETYRDHQLEKKLHQTMVEYDDWFDDVRQQSLEFFSANGVTPNPFGSSAGHSSELVIDDLPRSVVDYSNAHSYINPDAPQVQQLLNERVFPNGLPDSPDAIIEGVHAFMLENTQYVSDGTHDDWADVNDVASSLRGDCEDLINLEHSLLLAAFSKSGQPCPTPVNHAAYVTVDGDPVGHVFSTIEYNGQTMVLDPSLEHGGMVAYDDYKRRYAVNEVFTYTAGQTHVIEPAALGLETASGMDSVFDDEFLNDICTTFSNVKITPGASDDDIIRILGGSMIDKILDKIPGLNIPLIGDGFGLFMKQFLPGNAFAGIVGYADDFKRSDVYQKVMNGLTLPITSILESLFDYDSYFDELTDESKKQILENVANGNVNDLSPIRDQLIRSGMDLFNSNAGRRREFNAQAGRSANALDFPIYFDSVTYTDGDGNEQTLDLPLAKRQKLAEILSNAYNTNQYKYIELIAISESLGLTDAETIGLINQLQALGYMVNFQVVLPLSYSVSGSFLDRYIKEDYRYKFSDRLSKFLQDNRGLNFREFTLSGEFEDLFGDDSHWFNAGFDKFDVTEGIMDELLALNILKYDQDQRIYTINTFTMPVTTNLNTEPSIQALLQQQVASLGDMHGTDSHDLRSRFLIDMDSKGQRVTTDHIAIEGFKDDIRITQEKLRLVFMVTKMITESLLTLAAIIGDEQKAKVANGLQEIFESNFDLVNADVQMFEQIMSHMETAINHNVQVEKTRYEKKYDFQFKLAILPASMVFAKVAQPIQVVADIFETTMLHYDTFGHNQWSERYLNTNQFGEEGFIQQAAYHRFGKYYDIGGGPYSSAYNLKYVNIRLLRSKNFDLLWDAATGDASIQKTTGLAFKDIIGGELNGDSAHYLDLDYNRFASIRQQMVSNGMRAQMLLVYVMAKAGFLASLTKSIRGDGKVASSQALATSIDILEREVMHDMDSLNAIQSMHQEAVRVHNMHIDALQRVEKSVIEGVLFGAFFSVGFVAPSLFQSLGGLASMLTIKAIANMLHGFLTGFDAMDKAQTRLERKTFAKQDAPQEPESPDGDANRRSYQPQTKALTNPYELPEWMTKAEANYLEDTYDKNKVIYYQSTPIGDAFGFGHAGVNWYELAIQQVELKKLFAAWDAILKVNQSRSEAIQAIAEDLGAVVSSLSFTRGLKSSMAFQKSLMTTTLDQRYKMIQAVVDLFNRVQKERRETIIQLVKGVLMGLIGKSIAKQRSITDRNKMSFSQSLTIKQRLNPMSAKFLGRGDNRFLDAFNRFGEDIMRLVGALIRREQLESARAERSNQLASATHRMGAGSGAEAVLYIASAQASSKKIESDVIGEIKSYENDFKNVILDMKRVVEAQAREIAKLQTSGDAEFIKQKHKELSKSILKDDMVNTQRIMKEVAAGLAKPNIKQTWNLPTIGGALLTADNLRRSIVRAFLPLLKLVGMERLEAPMHPTQIRSIGRLWKTVDNAETIIKENGGNQQALEEFQDEKDGLITLVDDFQKSVSQDSFGEDTLIQSIRLLQDISNKFDTLSRIVGQFDDYQSRTMTQKLNQLVFSSTSNIKAASANIQSFVVFATAATVVHLNPHAKAHQHQSGQHHNLTSFYSWLDNQEARSPGRVYAPLAQQFAQLSNQDNANQQALFNFFKQALNDNNETSAQRQLAIKLLAYQQRNARATIQFLNEEVKNKDRRASLRSILNQAQQQNNPNFAKHLLYGHSPRMSGIVPKVFRKKGDQYHPLVTQWMMDAEENNTLVNYFNQLEMDDQLQRPDLSDGWLSAAASRLQPTGRLKKWEYEKEWDNLVSELSLDDAPDTQSKVQRLKGVVNFAAALTISETNKQKLYKRIEILFKSLTTDVRGIGPDQNDSFFELLSATLAFQSLNPTFESAFLEQLAEKYHANNPSDFSVPSATSKQPLYQQLELQMASHRHSYNSRALIVSMFDDIQSKIDDHPYGTTYPNQQSKFDRMSDEDLINHDKVLDNDLRVVQALLNRVKLHGANADTLRFLVDHQFTALWSFLNQQVSKNPHDFNAIAESFSQMVQCGAITPIPDSPQRLMMELLFGDGTQFNDACNRLNAQILPQMQALPLSDDTIIHLLNQSRNQKNLWEQAIRDDDGPLRNLVLSRMALSNELMGDMKMTDSKLTHAFIEKQPDIAFQRLLNGPPIDTSIINGLLPTIASSMAWLEKPQLAAKLYEKLKTNQKDILYNHLWREKQNYRALDVLYHALDDAQKKELKSRFDTWCKSQKETIDQLTDNTEKGMKLEKIKKIVHTIYPVFEGFGHTLNNVLQVSPFEPELVNHVMSHMDQGQYPQYIQDLTTHWDKRDTPNYDIQKRHIVELDQTFQAQPDDQMATDFIKDWVESQEPNRRVAAHVWLNAQLKVDQKKQAWQELAQRDSDIRWLLGAHGIALPATERIQDVSSQMVTRLFSPHQSTKNTTQACLSDLAAISNATIRGQVLSDMLHQLRPSLQMGFIKYRLCINIIADIFKKFPELANHSDELNGAMTAFLTDILNPPAGVTYQIHDQKAAFLTLLDTMPNDPFSRYMAKIEQLVGYDALYEFSIKNPHATSATPFEQAVSRRVALMATQAQNIDKTKFDSYKRYIEYSQGRLTPDDFFRQPTITEDRQPTITEDLAHLHQWHPHEFGRLCYDLSKTKNAAYRNHIFEQMAEKIPRGLTNDVDINFALAIQSMVVEIDRYYTMPGQSVLQEFFTVVQNQQKYDSIDDLFKESAWCDFICVSSLPNKSSNRFQTLIIENLLEAKLKPTWSIGNVLNLKRHPLYDSFPTLSGAAFDAFVGRLIQGNRIQHHHALAGIVEKAPGLNAPRKKTETIIQGIVQKIVTKQGGGIDTLLGVADELGAKKDFWFAEVGHYFKHKSRLPIKGKVLHGQTSLPDKDSTHRRPQYTELLDQLVQLQRQTDSSKLLMAHLVAALPGHLGKDTLPDRWVTLFNSWFDKVSQGMRQPEKDKLLTDSIDDVQRLMTKPNITSLQSKIKDSGNPFTKVVNGLTLGQARAGQFNIRAQLFKQQHLMVEGMNSNKLLDIIDALEKFDAYNRKNELSKQSGFSVGHVPLASVV